ncbi:MAG: GNAT family protein [Planctomycetota bacterium]
MDIAGSVRLDQTCLAGKHVRLEPASLDHAEAMHQAATPDTFGLFTKQPSPWTTNACHEYIRYLIDEPSTLPFSLFDAQTNELIGGTSYCDIRPAHRGLEIGWTWITPNRRGTAVNPEMKLLLLAHAFETGIFEAGPAIRVMLKTHHENKHSQAAISKLGATYEGTLRQHVIMPDGSFRDTVVYSILDSEWAGVKAGLLRRVA